MDFQDVVHWQNNKLDRTKNSRMGWTDLSICISGPVVQDLREHFVQRWNLIYEEKYRVRKDVRYELLSVAPASLAPPQGYGQQPPSPGYQQATSPGYQQDAPQFDPPPTQSRGFFDGEEEGDRGFGGREGGFRDNMKQRLQQGYNEFDKTKYGQQLHGYADRYGFGHHRPTTPGGSYVGMGSGFSVQLCRSCAKWSHGVPIEHSIANAYIETIRDSQHFVYIENQFFITATSDKQKPIKNKIGAAIVERILRAARNGENWKMIVIMPAIPAFAGDLRLDDALSTRAIMEFQYNSINRGGDSIYETVARAGYNPMEYIRFYNLRNYDRINSSAAMDKVEQISGVKYEDARKQFDEQYGGGFDGQAQSRGDVQSRDPYPGQPQYASGAPAPGQQPPQSYQAYHPPGSVPPPPQQQYPAELAGQGYQPPPPPPGPPSQQTEGYGDRPQYQGQDPYTQYQQAAQKVGGPMGSGRWDTVAECYMLNGEDIRNVPWQGSPEAEINAFVTEELYIHSKVSS